MTKQKIIWIILAILTFITFIFLIPNSIYNLSPFIFSISGTALTIFFIAQGIYDFKNISTYKERQKNDKKFNIISLAVIPLTFVFFMTYFINFGYSKNKEIDSFGIKVKGNIISKNIDNVRRKTGANKIYYATVKFTTKGGKSIISDEQISEIEYRSIYKGQEIELNYSSKDPNIVKLIFEKKSEAIKIIDLKTLFIYYGKNRETLLEHQYPNLNEIAKNKWKDNSNEIYIEDKKIIKLITQGDLTIEYRNELSQLNFKKVSKETIGEESYESHSHKIVLSTINDSIQSKTLVTLTPK